MNPAMHNKKLVFMLAAFSLSCIFITGCGRPKLNSKWRDREISINGEFDEWEDALDYYNEKTRVNIGAINDDIYLYICLISRNRGLTEQLTKSGFTVWFDPKGHNNKTLGIHFPFGMQDAGMPIREKAGGPIRTHKKDSGEPLEIFQEPWREIEIIGPGKEERYTATIETAKQLGISVKIGKSKGYFVYELKVPLAENEQHPYAIGVNTNNPIGIGFEASGFTAGMRRGMDMPGRGGRGGTHMPGGGEGMPGGREKMHETEEGFQIWLTVILSPGGKG